MNGRCSPLTMDKTIEELGEMLRAIWEPITEEELCEEVADYSGILGAQDFHVARMSERRTAVRYTRVLRFVTIHEFDMWVQIIDEGILDEDGDPLHKGWIQRSYMLRTDEQMEPA